MFFFVVVCFNRLLKGFYYNWLKQQTTNIHFFNYFGKLLQIISIKIMFLEFKLLQLLKPVVLSGKVEIQKYCSRVLNVFRTKIHF